MPKYPEIYNPISAELKEYGVTFKETERKLWGHKGTKNTKKLFKIKNKTDVIARLCEAIFRFVFSIHVPVETKLKILAYRQAGPQPFLSYFLLEKASQWQHLLYLKQILNSF